MKTLFLLSLLSLSAFAIETDISGNIEGQARHSTNNSAAKDDLFQDWDQEEFYLLYGNLNGKVEMDAFKLETNWFVRHSVSPLYDPAPHPIRGDVPYAATQIYTFPNRLVARDVFKLQYDHQQDNYRTESILNKFFIEWNYDEHRVTAGRMYINYGLGETFNPINPFNQPTGLTAISQVAQGNDGGSVAFFLSDKYTVEFLLLGDKRIEGYEGQIDHTLWVHGEYQYSDKLQLDYVVGEDQNRQKVGGQVAYRFVEAMVFTQLLYQSNLVTHKPSNNLWDFMLGYDQQVSALWHVRIEGGYQKANRYLTAGTFGDRFLPTEYFIALANVYEVHPLVKLNGTVVNDIKSGFTYFIAKSIYSFKDNYEAELFGYVPVAKGDAADNPAQKLVTTDLGVALRAFF
ncbi:MAG TPA: hypothetical protein VNJ08_06760 [Bacteriovoracaceae bacterium]|nr:hypothetical protein [Bacteriovoracaceae bacterium]